MISFLQPNNARMEIGWTGHLPITHSRSTWRESWGGAGSGELDEIDWTDWIRKRSKNRFFFHAHQALFFWVRGLRKNYNALVTISLK